VLRMTRFHFSLSVLLAAGVLAGCSTTQSGEGEIHQFSPVPAGQIGAQDLEPVLSRSASEYLDAANEAFRLANEAQEEGDHDEAYRQYTLMMELLLESDLDPTIFYNLRSEFGEILDTSTKIARTFERTQPSTWNQEVVELALRSELEFPNPLNDRVLAEIEAIRKVYPNGYQSGYSRSFKYLPHIREEFKKAGLPEDLVWLAMVESQFTPRINSHAGAGGMWQFMRSTGRRYGLRSDYYVDDRYDWKKSTQAAIQYLTELYEMFDGSWPLAVSAYNMGEAGLERAIASNGGDRDFWSLIETPPAANRIRRETKKFYPKLLASVIVANDPAKYGIKTKPQDEERTETVTVKGQYSIQVIEQEAGYAKDTLAKLNPQYIRGYTPPGRVAELSVPIGARAKIAALVEDMPELRPGTHTVMAGETLSGIAALHRVAPAALQTANNISSPRRLQIGQRLVIPGVVSRSGAVAANSEGQMVYTVTRGDSLSQIASRHRVSVNDLQAWNNLGRSTRIHVGDRIYVSAGQPKASTESFGEAIVYTVRAGDYPAKIAKSFNVRLNDFLAWNGLTTSSTIRVGQQLKVYNATTAKATYSESPRKAPAGVDGTHTVRGGDTASTIAQRYRVSTSDLLVWNDLSSRSVLQLGDVLYVRNPGEAGERELVAAAVPKAQPEKVMHTVRRGQNPTTIAERYDVALPDLFKWNGWTKAPVLQIGEEIVVMSASSTD